MKPSVDLFSPVPLGPLTLKNRVVFGAHTTNLGEAGRPGNRMRAYYVERARGGASLVVTEPVPVSAATRYSKSNLVWVPQALEDYRLLTQSIHEAGAYVFQQLLHLGAHVDGSVSERPALSPHASPSWVASQSATGGTARELARVVDDFVTRAIEAQDGGFDGVELFGNYQGLLEQTWTAQLAACGDKARDWADICHVSAEICWRIRERCGSRFAVGMAVSVLPDAPGVLALEDVLNIVAWHDREQLLDYVSCGSGGYRDTSTIVPSPFQEARVMRRQIIDGLRHRGVRALLLGESAMHEVPAAENALREGADLVSLVRAQICEPAWVTHAQAKQHKRIRPCTACNQSCIGRRARDLWISCLSNPRAGRESELPLPTVHSTQSSALIVGGGPAGLEAARTLALRGWSVTLHERASALGGKMRLMWRLPGLERHVRLIEWYEAEITRLGVNVFLERDTPQESLPQLCQRYDAVVWATGATPPSRPFQRAQPAGALEWTGSGNVAPLEAVLDRPPAASTRLIVIDDNHHHRGLTAACWLQDQGVRVTLVTSQPAPGGLLAGAGMQMPLRQRFARAGGEVLADTVLLRWRDGQAELRHLLNGESFVKEAEGLAWACASTHEATLPTALTDLPQLFVVGDAAGERDAEQAILEAHRVSSMILVASQAHSPPPVPTSTSLLSPLSKLGDGRLVASSASSNLEPIAQVLRGRLSAGSRVLELASGTGQHIAAFAQRFPTVTWTPSDIDDHRLASISAWRRQAGHAGLMPPMRLDVTAPWEVGSTSHDMVLAINLIHLISLDAVEHLLAESHRVLRPGGCVFLYAPMRDSQEFFSDGNARFDASLSMSNPALGLRDIGTLISMAAKLGFASHERVRMPMNNHVLKLHMAPMQSKC